MKSIAIYSVLMAATCSLVFGYAEKNPLLYAPQISPVIVDGSFSDWAAGSDWVDFGKWYNGGLSSTTRARYAWNPSFLFIAVESTEGPDLILEVGGLYGTLPHNRDTSATSEDGISATQIEFSGWMGGVPKYIVNQEGGIKTGVRAAYTYDGTTMRIEMSFPIYSDWNNSSTGMVLNSSMDVYTYINVFNGAGDKADSQVANGTYMYLAGGSAVSRGTMVRLRSQAKPLNCEDVPFFGKNIADFDGNCEVNLADFATLAAAWMECTDPNGVDCVPVAGQVVYVDRFGAVGDGMTDDTSAFQQAANSVQNGGAIILGRNKVYRVGQQLHTEGAYPYYKYQPVISINGVRDRQISIIGNGATLKVNDGLRFGSFDKYTGIPYEPNLPFYNYDYRVDVGYIISVTNCDDVVIKDLTVDGNIESLVLGGFWGDTGRQCAAIGIYLHNNNQVSVSNIYSHHHALDGVLIGWEGAVAGGPSTPHVLNGIESYYNARQGLSWVGGIGLTVNDSKFNFTGKSRFASSPGAGLDIEPENSVCIDGVFNRCKFLDCSVVGVAVQVSPNEHGNVFNSCVIQGVYPGFPIAGCTFTDCVIY